MALKDKIKIPKFIPSELPSGLSRLPELLYWRLALIALVLLCLVLASVVWVSGKQETYRAFRDGRRLLIRLDNGDIQGKMVSTGPPAAEQPPTADKQAAKEPHPDAADAPPALPVEEEIKLPATLAKSDDGPITAAAVPLAAVSDALAEKPPDGGTLPAIGKDGTKPWQYYAKPYERKGGLPMIAVIITGLGESKAVSESADRLPENFSLSFSPYAGDVADLIKTARTAGHEAFLDLPLEPGNYPASDPGPHGLLLSKPPKENASRLQWLMEQAQGYVGFVTPQNEAYSSNPEYFKALLQTLSEHGLVLAVGHEPAKNETKQLLDSGNTATITADTLIDEDLSPTAIQARLTSLEQTAKLRGYAVGVAGPFPVTLQQLKAWEAKLPADGFVLVPVTFIVRLRFS